MGVKHFAVSYSKARCPSSVYLPIYLPLLFLRGWDDAFVFILMNTFMFTVLVYVQGMVYIEKL